MKNKVKKQKQMNYTLELSSEEMERVLTVVKKDVDDDIKWFQESTTEGKLYYKNSIKINQSIIAKIFSAYIK